MHRHNVFSNYRSITSLKIKHNCRLRSSWFVYSGFISYSWISSFLISSFMRMMTKLIFFFSTKNWYLDSRVKLVEDEFDFVEPLSLVVWLFSSGVFEDFHSDDNGKLPVGTVFWMCFKNFGLKSTGWQCCFVWVLVSLKRKAL